MTTWALEMRDLGGATVIADCMPQCPELNFGFALNDVGTIDFRLPTTGTNVTRANYTPGQRTLHLKAGGTIVWAGFLLAATADRDFVSFSGKSWEFALAQSIISANERYGGNTPIDQLDIAWDLVSTYVTMPTGITRASAVASGKNRKRTWCCDDMTTVFDAVTELGETLNGFDWWLTPAKVWTTAYQNRGTNRSGTITLSDATNLEDAQLNYDTEGVTNRLWFAPHNIGTCSDIQLRDFGGSPAAWKRESGMDLSDVRDLTDRQEIIDEFLREGQPVIQVTGHVNTQSGISFGAFDLGDILTVVLSRGFQTQNTTMKVMDYKVNLAEDDVESMDVTMDNVTA